MIATFDPSVGTTPSQIAKIAMMVGFWALIPDKVTYLRTCLHKADAVM
jgi:hypothetical protein